MVLPMVGGCAEWKYLSPSSAGLGAGSRRAGQARGGARRGERGCAGWGASAPEQPARRPRQSLELRVMDKGGPNGRQDAGLAPWSH